MVTTVAIVSHDTRLKLKQLRTERATLKVWITTLTNKCIRKTLCERREYIIIVWHGAAKAKCSLSRKPCVKTKRKRKKIHQRRYKAISCGSIISYNIYLYCVFFSLYASVCVYSSTLLPDNTACCQFNQTQQDGVLKSIIMFCKQIQDTGLWVAVTITGLWSLLQGYPRLIQGYDHQYKVMVTVSRLWSRFLGYGHHSRAMITNPGLGSLIQGHGH